MRMTEGYSDIGILLTRARERMGMNLWQASQAMHIRVKYLEALENGNLADMPGTAYTKGYLQAYASFLQLDKEEILRRFTAVENALPQRGFFFPEVFSKEKKPGRGLIWGSLALAFVAYLSWV